MEQASELRAVRLAELLSTAAAERARAEARVARAVAR